MCRIIVDIAEEDSFFQRELEELLLSRSTVSFRYEKNKSSIILKNDVESIRFSLCSFGLPTHLKGVTYLAEAAAMWMRRAGEKPALTKEVYPFIAVKYNTSPGSVERAIRHAITKSAKSCGKRVTHPGDSLFQETTRSNGAFLSTLCLYLSKE